MCEEKDLDPGQVILLKENVLLVPPEIPVGCEMAVMITYSLPFHVSYFITPISE